MCSINLILSRKESSLRLKDSAINMAGSTLHRGPDSTRVISGRGFSLCFNRLEIVGGSDGSQPISNETNKIHLICNGEIFNYKELIKKYKQKHVHKTTSDVEVLLHLYEESGPGFVKLLEGQFAFAIVDENKGMVILGRDRFGINPLFYYTKGDLLVIASEMKAIFNSGFINNISLNPEGIAESWFFYGPIPPNTSFTNILQLPPASLGIYNMNTNELVITSYWSLEKQDSGRHKDRELNEILSNSVKKRLQGDHGPGVYVSGGLDSSIIAFLVKRISKSKPELFSIAFKDRKFDESKFQDQLAKFLGCRLHKIYIDTQIIVKNIKQGLFHTETPLIRSAPIPMMLLSKEVKKWGIKFILCGEGADELFLGYPVFAKGKSSIQDKWEENRKYIRFFVNPEMGNKILDKYKKFNDIKMDPDLLSARKIEIQTKLSQYLLTNQGDRMSMANSIEQRFPYLDIDVVNYALSMNKDILIQDSIGKDILRKTFKTILPEELVMRKKQGYLAPDIDVARELLKYQEYKKYLSEQSIRKLKIFNYLEVSDLIKRILSSEVKESDARFLLFIYTTQLLEDIFMHP
jgi:asparagine synthase (glutamine-hydrolysing)